MSLPLVDIDNLHIRFNDAPALVRGVSFTIHPGQCVALVGESGSGKSITARSLLGLTGDGARISADRFELAGRDARDYQAHDWRDLRGTFAGLVMQDALVSLDPLRSIGEEIAEVITHHRLLGKRGDVAERVEDLLRQVGVPEPARRARQYAHELSGGLRQRALIAAAIAGNPRLIIADEPTTALDATVQKQVIAVLGERVRGGAGLLLISHDLALVAQVADWVCVLHQGEVVDAGPVAQVLRQPRHSYTQQLLAATPSAASRGHTLSSARFVAGGSGVILRDRSPVRHIGTEEVLRVDGIAKHYRRSGWLGRKSAPFTALDGVSFTVRRGEVLGIVGESGSGKSTCATILLGLVQPDEGQVHLLGQPWSAIAERERQPLRRLMQYIPQDPLSSFDPRYTVQQLIAENLPADCNDARQAVTELLGQVGLDAACLGRRPRSLSGGQRQRVAIARALAARPALIICDEPVSALDVYVQAQVLDLIVELQARHQLSLVFISHDLGVVQHISDRVLVFHRGQVVEQGDVDTLFQRPQHAYTRELLQAV